MDILKGLGHLHCNGVLLCNLKPSNIVIDAKNVLKISDLSLSRNIKQASRGSNARARKYGSPHYMAPELFREDGVCIRPDIFSFIGATCLLFGIASHFDN